MVLTLSIERYEGDVDTRCRIASVTKNRTAREFNLASRAYVNASISVDAPKDERRKNGADLR